MTNDRLKKFFASDLALRAAAGIGSRAEVELISDGAHYTFTRSGTTNKIRKQKAKSPDVVFWVPEETLRQILNKAEESNASIPTLGIFIFERIVTAEEERKIRFKVRAGVLSLWTKGYFSVLKAGGPEVASYLARMGFNSLGKIKSFVDQIRS